MTIQNARAFLEEGGGIIKQKANQVRICTENIIFCAKSHRNIAETRLHPIQGTMKMRAVVPLCNGSIAV